MSLDDLLATVPDWTDWSAAEAWLREGLRAGAAIAPCAAAEGAFCTVATPSPRDGSSPFGQYADPGWRRAVLATFLADLLSYPAPVDQVSFHRLAFVMHAFPEGFRTFWVLGPAHRWWPVGYTGWHSMAEAVFATFESNPSALADRAVVPAKPVPGVRPFLYAFNYSVLGALRGTPLSSRLVKTLASDLSAADPAGLAAIAVSADGCRIAERFGMRRTGTLLLDGGQEHVYAVRLR